MKRPPETPLWGMQHIARVANFELAAISFEGRLSVASRLRRFFGLVGLMVVLAGLAIPAHGGLIGTGPASFCDPYASQAFGDWEDHSNYMLMPGGTFETGAPSWNLSGGAKIVSGNEPFYLNSRSDRRSLYMPNGSSASTPTMCFAAGDWHLRFLSVGPNRRAQLRVSVTVNSLLGVVSILDGGTVASDGTWRPSPQVQLLLTNVGGLLTTKAVSFRFTATDGASQIDDVYLDPFKDT